MGARVRKLVLKMSVSLDGFVGGPNGEVEWVFDSIDDEARSWVVETLWSAGTHLMGRRTFEDMVAYWPTSTEPYAAPMNEIPKVVFSRRGPIAGGARTAAAGWSDVPVASGDLVEEIARLKRADGKDLLAHGGASFARNLVAAGLVDEYRLLVHPVALGRGLPLFSELRAPAALRPVSTRVFGSGAVARVLRPA